MKITVHTTQSHQVLLAHSSNPRCPFNLRTPRVCIIEALLDDGLTEEEQIKTVQSLLAVLKDGTRLDTELIAKKDWMPNSPNLPEDDEPPPVIWE
tara:strand:+ start:2102 stop:2386 length:285 start_codon:yes stop_codon:yes gene_type:complete